VAVDPVVQRLGTLEDSRYKQLGSRTPEGWSPSHPLIIEDMWQQILQSGDLALWKD
jgi:hypothetical protein